MAYIYSGNVSSEITSVCSLVSSIIDELKSNLNQDDLMDLRLILSELMINGCEHGNHNDKSKYVTLNLNVTEKQIELMVKDEGQGLTSSISNPSPLNMTCSGRGLQIVKALCDEMRIEKSAIYCKITRTDGLTA